jgi:hypothetical protein
MVAFGEKFGARMIPEWRKKYVRYMHLAELLNKLPILEHDSSCSLPCPEGFEKKGGGNESTGVQQSKEVDTAKANEIQEIMTVDTKVLTAAIVPVSRADPKFERED